ncbi:CBS domain-containing protein [Sorangium sp. So ce315]|uniref:CBS domain-containing protein n=1 Tax=Sorangium sp. So ce315 TaxID=3133299 RepID=UPI003F5FB38E
MLRQAADASWQEVFPVLDTSRKMVGMLTAESLRIVAVEHDLERMTVAADAMQPPAAVTAADDLRTATEAMVAHGVRELPVADGEGAIVGFVDEADIGKAYLEATTRPARADETPVVLG